jgi:hypothetical protein
MNVHSITDPETGRAIPSDQVHVLGSGEVVIDGTSFDRQCRPDPESPISRWERERGWTPSL